MYIVILGNPIEGLSFYGPFDDDIEATKFAEASKCEWLITALINPERCV